MVVSRRTGVPGSSSPLRVTVQYRSSNSSGPVAEPLLSSSVSARRVANRYVQTGLEAHRSSGDATKQGGVRRVRFDLPPNQHQTSNNNTNNNSINIGGGNSGAAAGSWVSPTPTPRPRPQTQTRQSAVRSSPTTPASWSNTSSSSASSNVHETGRYRHGTLSFGTTASAIVSAAREGDHATLVDLLRRGVVAGIPAQQLNQRDAGGRSALSYLAGGGPSTLLELLLQIPGVDINLADNEGNTPLHFAAEAGQIGSLNSLVQRGADVDARNNVGFTPLMKAAVQGRTKCAHALLLAGASPTLRDCGRGLRAEQWARFCGRHVCAELIEKLARQRLLERSTAYGRWGSEPELQAALVRVQNCTTSQGVNQQQSTGIKSRLRRAFRTTSTLGAAESSPAFSLVTQLTGAGLCASSPALPAPAVPPVVKSLLRPLSVPRLQVTLASSADACAASQNRAPAPQHRTHSTVPAK